MASPDKATILIVDDELQMRRAMETVIARLGHSVIHATNGVEALEVLQRASIDLIVSDLKMPEMNGEQLLATVHELYPQIPFVMITAYGTIDQAVVAMKNGAFDFTTKPFSAEDLERIVSKALKPLAQDVKPTNARKNSTEKTVAIVTADDGFKKVIEIATIIAQSSASVLLQGESGTGKELLARLIHSSSPRRNEAFIAVNCAALPENLLESELFGHEKGAFTGATNAKIGKFELANGGTILLDEISEMAPLLQAKLLRVLQEREVDRVGGQKPIPVDVRVVATTNRNMQQAVAKGDFREDLYYRLNVVPIYVPPLRDRKNDVKLLIEHFIRVFSGQTIKSVSETLLKDLSAHTWPGNIRELQNSCERAVLLARGGELQAQHFLLGSLQSQVTVHKTETSNDLQLRSGMSVAEAEKLLIFETLKATANNRTKAADLLGISIRTLRNKLHEYGADDGESH